MASAHSFQGDASTSFKLVEMDVVFRYLDVVYDGF
jgi:hypothetical protein